MALDPDAYAGLAGFRSAMRRFLAASEVVCREGGITPQQYQAMLAIKTRPNETMAIKDLAQQLLPTKPLAIDSNTPTAEAFRVGHAVITEGLDDTSVERGYGEDYLAIARRLGGRSVIAMPLRSHGRTWGVLSLVSARPHLATDIELARELARRCATALRSDLLLQFRNRR